MVKKKKNPQRCHMHMFSMVHKLIIGGLWDFRHYLIYLYQNKACHSQNNHTCGHITM